MAGPVALYRLCRVAVAGVPNLNRGRRFRLSVALNSRLDNQLDQERNLHAQGNVCRVNQANEAVDLAPTK
ncbi:hypothetical protein PPUN12996_37000 [Pseudomonas putida]|nr:hypothetical protein PPUN12996_37000 [Pseudomonas putida]